MMSVWSEQTIATEIELDKRSKGRNFRRHSMDVIVAQTESSQLLKPEKSLQY